jgi:DNA-binding MarR family transcriptional regulator
VTERSGTPRRGREKEALGAALRRAWIGYQQRLEAEMASNGYLRRDFPDGRVLHICARSLPVTISDIGRELQISRQGASKVVRNLREHGFVTCHPSPTDGREKVVMLTPAARAYLDAQRSAARTVERRLQSDLGDEPFDALYELLHTLGDENTPRLGQFLRTHTGNRFE